jgi:hypothetical protein
MISYSRLHITDDMPSKNETQGVTPTTKMKLIYTIGEANTT